MSTHVILLRGVNVGGKNRVPMAALRSALEVALELLDPALERLRDDPVRIGLRLVLRALKIGASRLHVAERVDHLRWRIHLLHLHLLHQPYRYQF